MNPNLVSYDDEHFFFPAKVSLHKMDFIVKQSHEMQKYF